MAVKIKPLNALLMILQVVHCITGFILLAHQAEVLPL
jgi:hypothetical protein